MWMSTIALISRAFLIIRNYGDQHPWLIRSSYAICSCDMKSLYVRYTVRGLPSCMPPIDVMLKARPAVICTWVRKSRKMQLFLNVYLNCQWHSVLRFSATLRYDLYCSAQYRAQEFGFPYFVTVGLRVCICVLLLQENLLLYKVQQNILVLLTTTPVIVQASLNWNSCKPRIT